MNPDRAQRLQDEGDAAIALRCEAPKCGELATELTVDGDVVCSYHKYTTDAAAVNRALRHAGTLPVYPATHPDAWGWKGT